MRTPIFSRVLPAAILLAATLAAAAATNGGAALARPAPAGRAQLEAELAPSAALERALAAVRTEAICADIHFIGSDELGGRDSPSTGLRIAARFIEARLKRLGWEPGAPDGYLYRYPLETRQLDPERTGASAQIGERAESLRFGEDYFFYARGLRGGESSGRVVFCGGGTPEELDRLDLEGAWALVFDADVSWRGRRRAPEGEGEDPGPERRRPDEVIADRGALGLIVTPGPGYERGPYAERFSSQVARALRPSLVYPSPREEEEGGGARSLQRIYLEAASRDRLFSPLAAGEPPAVGADLGVTFTETRALAGEGGTIEMENVCGFLRGSDPELSNEVILLSAHYDHVGTNSNGVIFNGADDNGSGTCGLLALAEALAARGPLRRSVMLIWVSAEEKGLWGSQAWTENPWLPEGCRPVCNINLDMIGRNAPELLKITPTEARAEYNGLVRLAEQNAPLEGFAELGSADEYWSRSDHANFAKNLGIPVAFLFTDVHEDYHGPGDDPEKIDCDKIRRVVRLLARMLEGLQGDELGV